MSGSLPADPDAAPGCPAVVICGRRERAIGAAILLERAGHQDRGVLVGGPQDSATATGTTLQEGT